MILSLLALLAISSAPPCLKPVHHGHRSLQMQTSYHVRKPIACLVTTQIRPPNQATPDVPLDPIPLPTVSYYVAPNDPAAPIQSAVAPIYDIPYMSPWSGMDLSGMLFAGGGGYVTVNRPYTRTSTYSPTFITDTTNVTVGITDNVTNITYNTNTTNYSTVVNINKHPPAIAHNAGLVPKPSKAPELGQSGLGTSLTLLAGILLVIRARKNL